MSTRSPIAALPALLLVAVSVWEVCATRNAAVAVAGDREWNVAAGLVRAGYKPGDLIVFAPEWADPIGRLHLGDLIPIDMAARMDSARYGKIWEVAIRGARAPETLGLQMTGTTDRLPVWSRDIAVHQYVQTPAVVLADIRDGTPKYEGGAGKLVLAEVGFAPHRCIQIVPSPGHPVRATFTQLPLGTKLVGYVGLADVFKRREIRTPGKLEVEIGGKVVASAEPGIDDGWVRFEAATTPGPADVTFIASATAADRLICFAAEARQ